MTALRCRLLAILALAAVPVGGAAEPRRLGPSSLEVVVDGIARPQLEHNGRFYVEALKGREYVIRIRNPYPVRVAVALSVDGLNTIDARETSAAAARKWVLDPHEVVTIAGWQTSQHEARRFEFTTEARSYGQALGKTANFGVISAVFFKERVATKPTTASAEAGRDERRGRQAPASPAPQEAPSPAQESSAAAGKSRADQEYAATGMGRRTDHAVRRVWLDLEDRPSLGVDIRYEFRSQLVQLGVLPDRTDSLQRRERARGFGDDYAPVPDEYR